jgi:hypothetical protein
LSSGGAKNAKAPQLAKVSLNIGLVKLLFSKTYCNPVKNQSELSLDRDVSS